MGLKLPIDLERRCLELGGVAAIAGSSLPAMPEKQFMQRIVSFARARGWLVFHTYDSRRSAPGFPDLVLVRRGRLIMAEIKTQTGRLTRAQQEWLQALGECSNVEAMIWRPSDWIQIQKVLQ
jgi:hypothetical protein